MRYIVSGMMVALVLAFYGNARAETIVLKSGKQIQARILEKNDEYIKVDYSPSPLYYYWDSIESVDGQAVPGRTQKSASQQLSSTHASVERTGRAGSLDDKDNEIESLRAQLKESEQVKEDFARLKQAFKQLQAKYYNNLGGTFLYEKEFDRAAAAFQAALDIDPWNPEACFNLAMVYDNYMKDPKAAKSFYERYLVLVPQADDRREIEERIAELK